MTDDSKYAGQHTLSFSETRWYQRVWKFLPYLPREIPLFATVTISFWGIAEVLAAIGNETLKLKDLAIPALATSLVVATYRAIQNYRAYVPEALVSESKAVRKTFRKGSCGWQFAVARQMLLERTSTFDRTLARVESGAEYIPPKSLAPPEYIKWLQDRPRILLRLVHAVAVQCTAELPSVLATTKDEHGLRNLKDLVAQLSSLYEAAADFELDCRSVEAPEQLSDIHEMIYGWSAPVRNGVREFMSILATLATLDPRAIQSGRATLPSFNIEFLPPGNVDEFVGRLESIDVSAFELELP